MDSEKINETLSFNNIPEKLVIPLAAVTIFADPSVNFALQFQPLGEMLDISEEDNEPDDDGSAPKGKGKAKTSTQTKTDAAKTGEVVSLDQFRKK